MTCVSRVSRYLGLVHPRDRQDPSPRYAALAVAIGWAVPAIVDVVETYFSMRAHGTPVSLARAFGSEFPGWYMWAPLTPVIVWFDRQLVGARLGAQLVVLGHVVGATASATVHAGVLAVAYNTFDPRVGVTVAGMTYLGTLADYFPVSLMHYAVVLGASYTWRGFWTTREERVRSAELETRLARAELLALRAQLHPHFLFNTLNAVVSRVRTGDTQEAADVLTDLAELLRHFLAGATASEASLDEEIALASKYLAIEQARFPRRLTTELRIPDVLRSARVPTLLLQPLVENVVKHGVGIQEGTVHVVIEAVASGGQLILRVTDDGPGLPVGWSLQHDAGVGLANTQARLTRLYREAGALSVRSRTGEASGVEVVVQMPLNVYG